MSAAAETQPRRGHLPTAAQVRALTDQDALRQLADDLEREATRIETDLEFREGDSAWASRARAALALHRLTALRVARRLTVLGDRSGTPDPAERPAEDTDPLTLEVLAARPQIEPHGLATTGEVDAALDGLTARINAVTADREDEIGLPAIERDERFLAATGNALRHMRGLRMQLQTRRGQISKAEKKADQVARDDTRERLFIEAAREVLDRDTFLRVWDLVDRREGAQAAP